MKTIENTIEMEAVLDIQYGSTLEENASALTQGKLGHLYTESSLTYPWRG